VDVPQRAVKEEEWAFIRDQRKRWYIEISYYIPLWAL
jgi:hypothetical protein